MSADLLQFLTRLREGDEEAAVELVRRYELAIRVAIRTNLSDPRLRRQFDSLDVCQSVFASFFKNVAAGAYDLQAPAQLLALLRKMAENKLRTRRRDQYRRRRDIRHAYRHGSAVEETDVTSCANRSPEATIEEEDLLDRALELMTPEIRAIADRRIAGQRWPEIAEALGGTPGGAPQAIRATYRVLIAESLDADSDES